ncbi:hypothetical protein DCAR_0310032 [Daucus carota subsp. sativus]|uniref:Uncharacterized protein n=1 Tax=Daucus carota subsp. sativus TaxID=79200 RepID=A0A165ZJR7_DAUCS|nr:PREDICTED: protein IQ-DOMAIN 14-like [Daucus carota subsp. sativus]WOG90787.1 hypothetical protein DCAR_0310032 [Daucus carota subsp. sativus]
MGKTTRWLRSLFTKKHPPSTAEARRSVRSSGGPTSSSSSSVDANKHAIAVAAATAAVAEAALAAAQAAAEVVRLTSGGAAQGGRCGPGYGREARDQRKEWAAVVVQSAFRAYLARRALKALKALVKLQALVRGHIVRKQSTHMLQRMQAMARIQARACAYRVYTSESPQSSSKSSQSHQTGISSFETFDHQVRTYGKRNESPLKRNSSKSGIKDNVRPESKNVGSSWLDQWMEENSRNRHKDTSSKISQADDEKSDKILEVDTWKPRMNLRQGGKVFQSSQHIPAWNKNEVMFTPFDSLSRLSTQSQNSNPGSVRQEILHLKSLQMRHEVDQAAVWAVENSPGARSISSRPGSSGSRRGPATPARSEFSQNYFSGYIGHPNYMANTESYQAKVRSQSAPRQRMDFERPVSTRRFAGGYMDEETSSDRGWPLHGNINFRNRVHQDTGRSHITAMQYQGYEPTYGNR